MTCDHSRKIGDNYGMTCADCGEVLEGYGFFGDGATTCTKHLFLEDGKGFICLYCQTWKPAREDGEVDDDDKTENAL